MQVYHAEIIDPVNPEALDTDRLAVRTRLKYAHLETAVVNISVSLGFGSERAKLVLSVLDGTDPRSVIPDFEWNCKYSLVTDDLVGKGVSLNAEQEQTEGNAPREQISPGSTETGTTGEENPTERPTS